MQIRPLVIPDAFEIMPRQHGDDRGVFLEWFKQEVFERETGHSIVVAQANCSVSQAGVVRGVHYADTPPGQAKYVTCFGGAVLDIVIDIRVGSPTFGHVDSVRLDATSRRAVFLAEGLGHAFVALTDQATVAYLCSTPYDPGAERAVNPADPGLALPLPTELTPVISPKDQAAPSLAQARREGLLPDYGACLSWYQQRMP